jgi:uncharacterized protein
LKNLGFKNILDLEDSITWEGINIKRTCAKQLPLSETFSLGDKKFHVLHDIKMLDIKPEALGIQVVISGHSHRPSEEIKNGVIYLNPGSVGPRRFKLPIAMAILIIEDSKISINFVYL